MTLLGRRARSENARKSIQLGREGLPRIISAFEGKMELSNYCEPCFSEGWKDIGTVWTAGGPGVEGGCKNDDAHQSAYGG